MARKKPGETDRISRSYELRRFANSGDPDFGAALAVYGTTISPDVRTSSNEITYWLDRTYREFGDEFMAFGFYVEKQIIGFAQFAFLRQHRVLFLDYLVLHRDHRSHGEYFQFVRMLQEWVDAVGLEFDYAVAEVSYESGGDEPSEHSVLLVELFKQLGFGVAHCDYYQPPLGVDNPQSDMRAHLLVSGRERLTSLKQETIAQIIHALYFQQFVRWYTPFIDDISAYRRFLEKRHRELVKHVSGRKDVVVNGLKLLHPPNLAGSPPRAATRLNLRGPLLIVLSFGAFCAAFFFIQSKTQLGWQSIALVFGGALIAFAASFALCNRESTHVLTSLLKALTGLFGKRK